MSQWRMLFRFELRMIFRNPWFLTMPMLFALLLVWFVGRVSVREADFYQEAYTYMALFHTMTLGLVMLLGVLTVRRDIRRPSYEWSSALPVTYAAKISAKYAAGLLYFSLFTLLAGAVYAWASAQVGAASGVTLEFTGYFAASYEVSYIVTLALGMLLAICIPNRACYLIAFCAWMFGTFFMDIFLLDRNHWYVLRAFHLSQLVMNGDLGIDTWGIRLIADEQAVSRRFVLAFALLLLAAGTVILNRLRPTGRRAYSWTAAGIALLLAAGAFVPYGSIWQERYAEYEAKLLDPTIPTDNEFLFAQASSAAKSAGFLAITDYDIDLKRTADDRLHVNVRLQIPAERLQGSRELAFTLNRTFRVQDVQVAGAAATFTQQGERLTVKPAEPVTGGLLPVEMKYSGAMIDYMPRNQAQGAYNAFVQGKNVDLPWYMAWYPLPGDYPVYLKLKKGKAFTLRLAEEFRLTEEYRERGFSPIHFRLNVSGFETPLFSNLTESARRRDGQMFESDVLTGVRLVGGEFAELEHSGLPVRLVTTPYSVRRAEKMFADLNEMYRYFTSWIPDFRPKLEQVLVLPMYIPYNRMNLEDRTLLMNWLSRDREEDSETDAEMLMYRMLLGTDDGKFEITDSSKDVRPQIRALMWYVYCLEQTDYTEEDMKKGSQSKILSDLFQNRVGLQMVREVETALDEGKSNQVKEMLNYFYSLGLEIPGTEFDADKGGITYGEWLREWKKVMQMKGEG
ncbi:hypothetical protein EHV15_02945 [Paenibacillus oralis]|uniref:Uncharacterized protein n=1 Tax=Paenibacillus oralis TaxID=2490856 RepID=A0A3P3TXN7_9BACL|nr:hypothetical protein [Paenibacillus oralis]RRJ62038.1 hypothetical protein EHV15_02945 [Paenibacillus oralis]